MEELHGNYKVRPLNKIGNGGFGFVEKIELLNIQDKLCGVYARKIFSPQQDEFHDELKRRFSREVMYQASCSHKHVVHIYLCNLNSESPWFVMDLAKSDLQKDLSSGQLTPLEKLKAMKMILEGIIYIHDQDLLHRDIKPSNVLRYSDGTYKVSDFGLVKNMDKNSESEVLTKIAAVMGTRKYRAPEIEAAGRYSKQSDILALGVLMEDLEPFNIPGIQRIIGKSTSWRPHDRYSDVKEIYKDFISAIGDTHK